MQSSFSPHLPSAPLAYDKYRLKEHDKIAMISLKRRMASAL